MLFGAHQSVAGGLERAFTFAAQDRCDALQIFTKNSSQWREPSLNEHNRLTFQQARKAWSPHASTISHASYLINLCAPDPTILQQSRQALYDELSRANALGIDFVVVHPGAHKGLGEQAGLARIAESLHLVMAQATTFHTKLCIENTAGQGTTLGHRLDQIAQMIQQAGPHASNIGVCIDTQHAFAAGYDLRKSTHYAKFWRDFKRLLGIDRLLCMHINDSKVALGKRVDRHARIGEGQMGLLPFWRLANDPMLDTVPAIIELPPIDKTHRGYAEVLDLLRGLRGAQNPSLIRNPTKSPAKTSPPGRTKARP